MSLCRTIARESKNEGQNGRERKSNNRFRKANYRTTVVSKGTLSFAYHRGGEAGQDLMKGMHNNTLYVTTHPLGFREGFKFRKRGLCDLFFDPCTVVSVMFGHFTD